MSRFLNKTNRLRSGQGYRGTSSQSNFTRGARGRGRGGTSFQSRSSKLLIEPHRHPGIYIAKSKEDMLVTKNLVPGNNFSLSSFQLIYFFVYQLFPLFIYTFSNAFFSKCENKFSHLSQ